MNKLSTIQQIVSDHDGHEIIFKDPVRIKISPHSAPFEVFGVNMNETGLWLMDGQGEWHGPLQEDQGNAELVINSLYQRLKGMQLKAA